MLSRRGTKSAASQNIPWRFAPGGNNRFDSVTNPTGVISFATAENNLMHDELHGFVQNHVLILKLAYTYRFSTMGGPRFPVAMARHLNEYFNPITPVKAEEIITASGLTAIHELISHCLADPGDGILVSRPVYGRFELDFGNTSNLNTVYADMGRTDLFLPAAIAKYQERFDSSAREGVQIKAVLIVNPGNPLGRPYSAEALQALMAFCEKNKIHLISDEVYGLSTYNMDDGHDTGFTSVLSIDPTRLIDENRLHVLYGMSKDFAAARLRLGCLVARNSLLRKAVACNMRFHNPSGISIAIGTAILEDRAFVASFTKLSRERLKASRQYTTEMLENAGIRYKRGNAGFFVFVDLEPWLENVNEGLNPEFVLAQKLLDAGVGLHPCEEHAETKGQFRLVFSQERETLQEGLRRLFTVLKKIDHDRQILSSGHLEDIGSDIDQKANGTSRFYSVRVEGV